jgi:alginate O-acetyltransferase complex protein AlgI
VTGAAQAAAAPAGGVAGPCRERPLAELAVLVGSLLLCAWLDVRALVLVLAGATSDFVIGSRLGTATVPQTRRLLLLASVVVDLGLLGLWRAAAVLPGLGLHLPAGLLTGPGGLSAALPVGLSFFALRSLGYVVDVYRGNAAPCSSWVRYAAFLCFFPAFVAGPIARGAQLLPQLATGVGLRWDSLVEGASIFVQGLAKKMLIADRLATIADPVFAAPAVYPPWTVAAGILAYSLQVYCDFAGYSDMAIGAARAVGVDLPRNFDMPYLATSIAEFWRRWHITLSEWLRDYVFLPLAYVGSRWVGLLELSRRRGELLNYGLASMLTMLVAGLWHGAGWGFVIWGGAHGAGLALQRAWQGGGHRRRAMPCWLGRTLTFLFVCLVWVPFRAPTLASAAAVYAGLLGLGGQRVYSWFPSWLPVCAAVVLLGHLAGRWLGGPTDAGGRSAAGRVLRALGLTPLDRRPAGAYLVPTRVTVLGTYVIVVLLLSILLFSPPKVGPFVYAAF